MKAVIVVSVATLWFYAGQALAQCAVVAGTTSQFILISRLTDTTICGRPGANYPGPGGAASTDRWQEQHRASGELWDYKKGPGDPVDPSEKVGTWSFANNATPAATITHSYTGGSSFTYSVFNTGGVLSFCVGTAEYVRGRVRPGTNPCAPGDFPP